MPSIIHTSDMMSRRVRHSHPRLLVTKLTSLYDRLGGARPPCCQSVMLRTIQHRALQGVHLLHFVKDVGKSLDKAIGESGTVCHHNVLYSTIWSPTRNGLYGPKRDGL